MLVGLSRAFSQIGTRRSAVANRSEENAFALPLRQIKHALLNRAKTRSCARHRWLRIVLCAWALFAAGYE